MGHMHAAMATKCGLNIAACVDSSPAAAKRLAKKYRAKTAHNVTALLKDAAIDAVVISTPTPDHLIFIKAAAKAGKNIFCEKPLARSTPDCQEAIAATEKAGVKLFVGHVVRYFQEFEAIRAQITAGKIGKPGFVKTFRGGVFPGGKKSWFSDYKKSGGAVFDMLIHDFDWMRYTFGDVERIFCQSLLRSQPIPMDYALVTLRMKSGVIAHAIGSWAHPDGFRVKAEVCGSKGMVQYDSAQTALEVAPRKHAASASKTIVPGSPVEISPYQLEWKDFISWTENNRKPKVSPRDALEAVRIAEAALKSAETGKAQPL